MVGTNSSSAWVVLGLLLVPLVALGADAVQRGLESESFPTAPLHVNERFVYDVTVLSDFTGTATTAHAHIEVVVGDEDADGRSGVFPIRTTRGPAPWDATTQPMWDGAKERVDVRLGVVSHDFVDRDGGRVLVGTETSDEQQWYTHGGAGYRYALQTDAEGALARPGVASELARHARATWTHEVPVFGFVAPAADAPYDLPLSGVFDHRLVYGRQDTAVAHHDAGRAPFGCEAPAVAFDYFEPDTAARHAHIAMQVTTTRTVWRAPDLALPVVVECHRVYVSGDGADRGHIRTIVTLAAHDEGGAAHRVDWDDEPVLRPRGDHTAVPTVAPGVPADAADEPAPGQPLGEDPVALRFPMGGAHAVAREWLSAQALDFASRGHVPYALVAATYWPGTAMISRCDGFPDEVVAPCSRLPVPLQRPQQTFVEPHWHLTYENADAERIVVQVLRNMTTTGQVIEDSAAMVGTRHASPLGPVMHAAPDRLVPVHDMLAAWLDEEDLDLEAWRQQQAARLEYRLERSLGTPDSDLRPVYVFREGDMGQAPATPSEGRDGTGGRADAVYLHETTRTFTYHASDGVLLDRRHMDFQVEDAPVTTTGPGPASFALPDETTHRPEAAVIVGLLGLGTVALGATSGGRTWLRGLLALPLFTKLRREDVLEHRTRDAMIRYVKGNPGIGTEEIRRHFDIGWGTAVYHLSALEQNGLLSSLRRGGHRHWFAAGLGRLHDREAIALLRSAAARRLHEAIRSAPGRTQQELAAQLGVTHGAVIFQVRKLERVGLIRKERDGRFVRYFAAPADPRSTGTSGP